VADDLRTPIQRSGAVESSELDHFLRFAAERLSEALYWIAEDGTILYANQSASQLTGYSVEELLAMKMYDVNVDLDATSWPAIWGMLKAAGQRTFEARHRCRDGRILQSQVSANMFVIGGMEYSCAFMRDTTELKELEGRLRQAEKLEAVGRLAGGVAHDFNNQLAGIMGYAELLRRASSHNPKAGELVDQLCGAVKVAADLTAQLLAFSRRGKFLAEPVELHRLIRDVVTMLSRGIDRRVRVVTTLEAERAWTLGDPSQLQSAVLNLLLNARDAMPHGGTITVTTSNVEILTDEPSTQQLGLAQGHYIALGVHDTGVGMDLEMQARIFEPFFTTKETGGGTGLGLAAVYGTAKNHNGAVGVVSALGSGSQFTLYLPSSRAGVTRRDHPEEPPSLRLHGHVIVVDDECVVRESEVKMLEALGCKVSSFADADTAIAFFRRSHRAVDLVLLDLVMPGTSGADAFTGLRNIDPKVQVLICSGYSLDEQVQRLMESGAKGFLQKPFSMATLAGRVGSLLRS
jgi:two-component system cell cycle sensor histidine kinase/response regulator CckA